MPLEDFIIHTYILIDNWFKKQPTPLRKAGFSPSFTDAEVVTLEIVGE